jgi:hypothetical protein
MKTLLILWFAIHNGVATDSVKSIEFDTAQQCEGYAAVALKNPDVLAYQCIEGYALPGREE